MKQVIAAMTVNKKIIWLIVGFFLFMAALVVNMSVGSQFISPKEVLRIFYKFNEQSYMDFIVLEQRFPRSLIAIYMGACMAVGGMVLQGVSNNPLASPSLLGITSGALFFVVFFGFYLNVPIHYHGLLAFIGGVFGFAMCYCTAKMLGITNDPRGLSLILAGSIISLLLATISEALILADQSLYVTLRNWANGDINHHYIDRLYNMWFIGVLSVGILWSIARPLTLITLGVETAKSCGVNVRFYLTLAIGCTMVATTSATAIIGPIGFMGLVVPHLVRPLVGNHFQYTIPMCIFVGGALGLLVDSIARTIFLPFIVHTSVITNFIGGIVFIIMVKRFYLQKRVGA